MIDPADKLDLHSLDIAKEKRQELLRLFPEIRTEGGKLDFDRLRLALGDSVDVGKERYGMNWPGKADCFKTIQKPSLGTLRPCPEESVNFHTTENLIIEGDNLEVLKLLQKSYLGKVKMIYIDPPYNTGNDFIYPDNYAESLQTYLEYTKQVDAEGRKFGTNTDTDGRFHSKWLNMMYPRLYLARNLLREDGIIFISIDDNEEDNLKKICNEIFGESNFVQHVIWNSKYTVAGDATTFSNQHEHILCYARNVSESVINPLPRTSEMDAAYSNPDNDPRGDWKATPLHAKSGSKNYSFKFKNGRTWTAPDGRWPRFSLRRLEELENDSRIWFGAGGMGTPNVKTFLTEVKQGKTPGSVWRYDEVGHTHLANEQLAELMGKGIFDNPKPVGLIKRCLTLTTDREDIVLDFFSGSGTTAQGIVELNREDEKNRKFILVQLPESTEPGSVTQNSGFKTIAEVTKERIRRVIKKLNEEDKGKLNLNGTNKQDRGFRVYKLAESNFKTWDATVPHDAEALGKQIDSHVDHIRDGRKPGDLFYEILLKDGILLTAPVEVMNLEGKTVYNVSNRELFVCLERVLTLELIRAMAAKSPQKVVCLDEGFAGNDQLKANAVQIFKTKGAISFKTV